MVNRKIHFELRTAVLAGGEGKRLQEYTRDKWGVSLPKQFCALHGTATLLQRTVNRVSKLVPAERIVVTVPQQYLEVAASQVDGHRVCFAVQPYNRDTTAAVFLALLHIYKDCPDAVVVVVPADHFVSPEEAFLTSILRATATASAHRDKIVLIGCTPRSWDADLGFVVPATGHPANTFNGAIPVSCIIEKPNQSLCSTLVDDGAYWNTFIMVGSVSAFLNAGRDTVPGILKALEQLLPMLNTPDERRECKNTFEHLPISSFTRDVLCGLPDRLLLVPMDEPCHWMDLGRPERVEQLLQLLSDKDRNHPTALKAGIPVTNIAQSRETHGHAYS